MQDASTLLFTLIKSRNLVALRQIPANQLPVNSFEAVAQLEHIDTEISPLILCAHFGYKDIIRILLNHPSVDVDMETPNSRHTPLIIASMAGNYEAVRLLLIAKAEPNKPNALNHTALVCVLMRLSEEPHSYENRRICFMTAELLLKFGADPNWILDKKKGYTLLHYYCSQRTKMSDNMKDLSLQIVELLLSEGADPDLLTTENMTCQILLKKHSHGKALDQLIERYRSRPKRSYKAHNIKPLDKDYFSLDNSKKTDCNSKAIPTTMETIN